MLRLITDPTFTTAKQTPVSQQSKEGKLQLKLRSSLQGRTTLASFSRLALGAGVGSTPEAVVSYQKHSSLTWNGTIQ